MKKPEREKHRYRPAVRGLVVDSAERILLVRLVFPHGVWWVLPGGGIEENETEHDALHRELQEELGLMSAEIGPLIWRRTHTFDFFDTNGEQWGGQSEVVYLIRTPAFTPRPMMTKKELEAENIDDIRWWTRTEISQHQGTDNFAPPDLGHYLERLFDVEQPDIPFEIIHSDS